MKSKHFHIGRGTERLGAHLRQDICYKKQQKVSISKWIAIKHEENAEFENEQIEVPGLVGNVAVA